MPILTWQNVPVGDLGASQEGFRNASAMLDRAVRAGTEGAATFDAIDANKRAFAQQTADKVLAAKMISFQDPEAYKAAMANGTLADPAIMQGASIGALLKADAQRSVLQGRAQADQNLLGSKQAFENQAYNMNRQQSGDRLSDAAMPMVNQALKVAVKDRVGALKMIQDSGMHLEDQAKAVAMIDAQLQDTTQRDLAWARRAEEKADRELLSSARNEASELLKITDRGEQMKRFDALKSKYGKRGGDVQFMVNDMLKRGPDANFETNVSGYNPSVGVNPSTVSHLPYETRAKVMAFNERANEAWNGLPEGARAIIGVERAGLKEKSAAEVVAQLGKDNPTLLKNFDAPWFMEKVNDMARQARADGVKTNVAEIAWAMLNNLEADGITTVKDAAYGVNLVEKRAKNVIDMLNVDRERARNFKQVTETRKAAIEKKVTLYDGAAEKVRVLKAQAKAGRDVGDALEKAEHDRDRLKSEIDDSFPTIDEAKDNDPATVSARDKEIADLKAQLAGMKVPPPPADPAKVGRVFDPNTGMYRTF